MGCYSESSMRLMRFKSKKSPESKDRSLEHRWVSSQV